MPRHWLLTSTFYGNWVPGDRRGFVSRVRDLREDDPETSSRIEHDLPGVAYDKDCPGLERSARMQMTGPPILIDGPQAGVLFVQFRETATYRGWTLLALAIMPDHIHLVVGVEADPEPGDVLGDFKGYGSRALNREWGMPPSETWWTSRGSNRKLPDGRAVRAAVEYVRRQEGAYVIWVADAATLARASGTRQGAEESNASGADSSR